MTEAIFTFVVTLSSKLITSFTVISDTPIIRDHSTTFRRTLSKASPDLQNRGTAFYPYVDIFFVVF